MDRREILKTLAALPLVGKAFSGAAGPASRELRPGITFIPTDRHMMSSGSLIDPEFAPGEVVYLTGSGAEWWNIPGGICCRTEKAPAVEALLAVPVRPRPATIKATCICGKELEIPTPPFGSTWIARCGECTEKERL